MRKKWKKPLEIKELLSLNVSKTGGGLYLYLPRDTCAQYHIDAGDRIKLQLRQLFKRDWAVEGEGEEQPRGG